MSDQNPPTTPPPDWRDMRREERGRRREMRGHWHGGPWIGGLFLIALGVAFLLRNFGYPLPDNWWALFLLVPAVAAYWSAWNMYEQSGRQITSGVRGGLIGGTILTLLAIIFFLDIDFGKLWPVILIVIGVSLLAGGSWRR